MSNVSMIDGHIDRNERKLTEKNVIKALNTATNIDGLQICCINYENDPETKTFLSIKSDIVDLINRQQAKNEVLVEDTLCLRDTLKENESLRAEIERLQKENNQFADLGKTYSETRAGAIKGFVERLCEGRVSNDPVVIAVKCELKEMVSGDKVQWSKQGECPMTPEQFNAIYDDEMVGEDK